ncbi:MAG: alkaline phosphatase family protein [Gemmatimonadales bacterium]
MRRPAVCGVLVAIAACAAPRGTTPERDPLVVLIGVDGFRADYLERPAAATFRSLAERGVRAEKLVPVFPTKTFPNFYTIATGLYPTHHGIVANTMRDSVLGSFTLSNRAAVEDGRWWGGEPIWVTAIRAGHPATAMFWPGSEADVGGVRPTEWRRFTADKSYDERVEEVLGWLGRAPPERPIVTTLYFDGVDAAGHRYGPGSVEVDSAIARVDRALASFLRGLADRGLDSIANLVVVSDHGMAELAPDRVIWIDDYLDSTQAEIVDLAPVTTIAPKPGAESAVLEALAGRHPHLAVHRADRLPARLHADPHPRVPAIVAIADPGWSVRRRAAGPLTDRGNHGFDPEDSSMAGILIAAGPAFRSGAVVPPLSNVHLYALLAGLLGLEPAPNDGSPDSVRALLR